MCGKSTSSLLIPSHTSSSNSETTRSARVSSMCGVCVCVWAGRVCGISERCRVRKDLTRVLVEMTPQRSRPPSLSWYRALWAGVLDRAHCGVACAHGWMRALCRKGPVCGQPQCACAHERVCVHFHSTTCTPFFSVLCSASDFHVNFPCLPLPCRRLTYLPGSAFLGACHEQLQSASPPPHSYPHPTVPVVHADATIHPIWRRREEDDS
jgi:hypothetical protein